MILRGTVYAAINSERRHQDQLIAMHPEWHANDVPKSIVLIQAYANRLTDMFAGPATRLDLLCHMRKVASLCVHAMELHARPDDDLRRQLGDPWSGDESCQEPKG